MQAAAVGSVIQPARLETCQARLGELPYTSRQRSQSRGLRLTNNSPVQAEAVKSDMQDLMGAMSSQEVCSHFPASTEGRLPAPPHTELQELEVGELKQLLILVRSLVRAE